MERTKNYIILGLVIALGIFVWLHFQEIKPEPIDITIPGSEGTTGDVEIEEVKTDTVEVIKYLPGKVITKEEIVVDSTYKAAYEQAVKDNDSLKAKNLFLESIQIKEYNEVAIDNDTIKIDLYAKTRGSLLAYKIDYDIKDQSFTYTPEVVHIRPKLTVLAGIEAMIPQGDSRGGVKFDLGVQGQKGNIWSVGVDTQGNKYIGFKKSWTLFK